MKTLLLSLVLLFTAVFSPYRALSQPKVPVLLARANTSKVMLLLDDSGSMSAGMVHPEFDVNDPNNSNTAYRVPMFMLRLDSGANPPANSHRVTPLLMTLQRGLYVDRNSTSGDIWDTTRQLSQVSTQKFISHLYLNSGSRGVFATRQFGLPTNPAVTGSSVFTIANLAYHGGSPITDSAGNEVFFFDVPCTGTATIPDSMCGWSGQDDMNHTFVRFDAGGNVLSNKAQRFYATKGGEINFYGRRFTLAQGIYEEKYIRWLLHFATPEQLATLPTESRIQTTRRIVTQLINENPSIQFGISTLNGTNNPTSTANKDLIDTFRHPQGIATEDTYAVVRAPIGSDKATLLAAVANMGAKGGTPLHGSYVEIMRYFDARRQNVNTYYGKQVRSGADYTTPITSDCDNHFVVLLTDGIPFSDCRNTFDRGSGQQNIPDMDGLPDAGYPGSTCASGWESYLDDASMLAHQWDFSNLIGTQSLTNFAIGLGLRFDVLDRFAEYGGSGTAYKADSVAELEDAFDTIINSLITTPVSGAGVALAEAVGYETRVFRPTFYQKTWRGTLDVFRLENNVLTYQYDMGQLLETRNDITNPRRIYAGNDSDGDGRATTMIDFDTASAGTLRPQLFKRFIAPGTDDPTDLADPIEDPTNDASAATLINYIRGNPVDDMRSRDYNANGETEKLGDIIYSRPIEIGPVNGSFFGLDGYADFTAGNRNQQNLVVVGANDGMLHAFDASTGEELWSYIPSNLLPQLEYLARMDYNLGWHQYYVDGQMLAQDVYLGGSWRTLLIFGQREGGAGVTVLDVTDRANPSLLFEVSDPVNLGETWTQPTVVKAGGTLSSTSGGDFTWFLAMGSGPKRTAAGTKVMVYNLAGGGASSSTITLEGTSPAGTRTSGILWVNADKDVNDDRGYIGTEDGDLFRINVTGTTPGSWSVTKLYDGTADRPIVATPVAVLARNPQYVSGGANETSLEYSVMVSFGTGKYDEYSDINWYQTRPQRIVGIFDPVNPSNDTFAHSLSGPVPIALMQKQNIGSYSSRITTDKRVMLPLGKKGFYTELATSVAMTGNYIEPLGMVLHQPLVARGAIVYSTFVPSTETCGLGGNSFLQVVDFLTGGGVIIDGIAEQPINPRYAGGILDYNSDSNVNSQDLSYGLSNGMVEVVMDSSVSAVNLSDPLRPYQHDGVLDSQDIRLTTGGGILPTVSALGNAGAPSPPVLSYFGEMIIVQNAFVVEPEFDASGGTPGTVYNETPPTTMQFNLYTIPPKLLSFHEVVRD